MWARRLVERDAAALVGAHGDAATVPPIASVKRAVPAAVVRAPAWPTSTGVGVVVVAAGCDEPPQPARNDHEQKRRIAGTHGRHCARPFRGG